MTIENILSDVNYNIKKILEELRKRITDIPGANGVNGTDYVTDDIINEIIDDRQIIYQHSEGDKEYFCMIKIKKNYLEIDFVADKIIEDPIGFSWKIRPTKKYKFNRRMQIRNISDIDTTFGLIFQSYNVVR